MPVPNEGEARLYLETGSETGGLVAALKDTVGDTFVSTGADIAPAYLCDATDMPPCKPFALVRPACTSQVAAILALASTAGRPVVVQGGRTGLAGGAHPLDGEIILSMDRMSAIEDIDPVGRTMTVQAGATLQAIQSAAEEAGLLYPVDLGSRGSCTIGGNAATNAGGVQVLRYGMTRRQILGLEAVFADGRVLSSLNRVVKNNTGYDWKELIVGSEGTLAVITRLVLALQPRPSSRATALCAVSSLADAFALQTIVEARCGASLVAFEAMWRGYLELTAPQWRFAPPFAELPEIAILVETVGTAGEGEVTELQAALEEAFDEGLLKNAVMARSLEDRARFWDVRESRFGRPEHAILHFDVSVPRAVMQDAVEAWTAIVAELDPKAGLAIFGHLADANLHLAFVPPPGVPIDPRVAPRILDIVRRAEGSVSAEHGIGTQKKEYLGHTRSQGEIDLMRTIKLVVDPKSILNRSRVI